MKKKHDTVEADDLAIYEPVNSEFREHMFMKWRAEGKVHETCGPQCKSRNKKIALRKQIQLLLP
jgi:hypothetical protein